jgi:hypothetical protein
MFRRLGIALLAVTVSVPLCAAQRRGGMGRAAAAGHARFARGGASGRGLHRGRWPLTGDGFLGYPYSGYDYADPYLDLAGSSDNSYESAPQVVAVQPASAGVATRPTRLAPLLIEWQGDRYVRFGGAAVKEEDGGAAHPDYAEHHPESAVTGRTSSAIRRQRSDLSPVDPPKDLPPTVLVYRDGHREEIPDYAIADGVIYIRGGDWQSGAWTKQIPLSALDAAATVQANQERGAKFMLPSASNVVIASF